MSIIGGFDVHRRQITFNYVDTETGQLFRGQIAPACRPVLRRWLTTRFGDAGGDVSFAVEGCTGWRFVVEELHRAGITAYLAEPADTAAARGRKSRAKTDPSDAALMRQLLSEGRLPTSWIPPEQVLEMRAVLELYKDLRDEHTGWIQRIHATLFHQGVPALGATPASAEGRALLAQVQDLSPAGRQAVTVALRVADAIDTELAQLHRQIRTFASRQPGCKALQAQYGVGAITSTAIWAMMGDTRRFSASRKAVRHTGLDVSVYSSDGKRTRGHLAKQGPALLRWALYEAACLSSHTRAPDHAYYASVRERIGHKRAALSVARKIARRSHHILRGLGEKAYPTPA